MKPYGAPCPGILTDATARTTSYGEGGPGGGGVDKLPGRGKWKHRAPRLRGGGGARGVEMADVHKGVLECKGRGGAVRPYGTASGGS